MAYRMDHDAALARVDVLQREVTRLADENRQLRETTPRAGSHPGLAIAGAVLQRALARRDAVARLWRLTPDGPKRARPLARTSR